MQTTTTLADALPALAAHIQAAGPVHALGPGWMDPSSLITGFLERYGSWAIIAIACIIFIETGLLFPILPGDSLLFMAGAFTAQNALQLPLPVVVLILFAAAVAGNSTGYTLGRVFGSRLFDRPDSKIFKRKYIDQTHAYFDRYGGRTITIAQFVPIVRTYSPVAAGIGRMRFRHFIAYNALGALLWAVGITVLGYLLGNITFVKNNVEVLVLLIVAFSLVPMVVEVLRERRKRARAESAAASATRDPLPGTFDDDGTRPPRHAR
jgi:membrane-associated protein